MGNPFQDPNAPIKQKKILYPLVGVSLAMLIASLVFLAYTFTK